MAVISPARGLFGGVGIATAWLWHLKRLKLRHLSAKIHGAC